MAKAKKPWYRARNVVLLSVAAVAAWIGYVVYGAVTAKPGAAINYGQMAQRLILENQPEGADPAEANAWTMAEEAFAAQAEAEAAVKSRYPSPLTVDYSLVYHPISVETPGYDAESQAKMRAATREAIELMREQGVFDLMDRVARTPAAVRPGPQGGPMVHWLLPSLGQARQMARMGAARMFLAAEAGDGAELARAYEHTLALGRICTQQAFLIDHLVGFAILATAHAELSRIMTDRELDEPTLRACRDALERQMRWRGSIETAIEGERLSILDSIQWLHTDDGKGNGRLIMTAYQSLAGAWGGGGLAFGPGGTGWMGDLSQYKIINLAGLGFAGKRAVTAKANDLYDRAVRMLRAEPRERARLAARLDSLVEEIPARYMVLKSLMPALGRIGQSDSQDRLYVDAARVHIAIERYRARHGEPPKSLRALAPEFLRSVPRDALTGAEFGYRRLAPGEDPRGRKFLLYSFGLDGVDDGGKTDKTNFAAMRRPVTPGFDLIINEPRERQEDVERQQDWEEPPDESDASEGG